MVLPDLRNKSKSAENSDCQYSEFSPKLEDVANLENLYQGYLNARKGKRSKVSVLEFEKSIGTNLINIRNEILSEDYVVTNGNPFVIKEGRKIRNITPPSFKDLVVQHTIYMLVYDVFDKSFIHDSYGCRINGGTHRASDKLQSYIRKSKEPYYLQLDIRKYYPSMDHSVLRERLSRKIKDIRLIDLMMKFTSSEGKGVLTGNLLAQFYGLVYLDRLDHYCKRVLKIKNYIRYVDDIVIVNLSKSEAKIILNDIINFISGNLKLSLSKQILSLTTKGINFVGFRTWKSRKFIRKLTLFNFSKAIKQVKVNSIISILGHSLNTSSLFSMKNRLNKLLIGDHDDLLLLKNYYSRRRWNYITA